MKKFILCFFWLLCCIPFAGAVEGGTASRVLPGSDNATGAKNTDGTVKNKTTATNTNSSRTAVTRTTVARAGAVSADETETTRTSVGTRKTNASRANQTSDINSPRTGLDAAVNTVGRSAHANAASANSNPAVRRAGLSLRPSTAEVGGRAIIAGTDRQTGSNLDTKNTKTITSRAANNVVTRESLEEAKTRLEQTADLNKSCQEQYNDCMDQFCAVVDSNQKRCSCSANLDQYAKVEEAVKDANTQLNEVAQNIRYIGLSADEIRAIMTATEAEKVMDTTKDTTETRSMLEEIEEMIKDPTAYASSYGSSSSSLGLDMDIDFSSSSDLFGLDLLNTDSSISSQRGKKLYNTAKARCKTVLNQCKNAGATSEQITANYDLAIDKDCIAYEQGLNKMNESLLSNVRSANLMLQKARLALKQNKNQYDAKECVAALETCMKDDMVCGSNYFKCLDPTKQYIDENGEVVLGQNISNILKFMEDYNNSAVDQEHLKESYAITRASICTESQGKCIIRYLLQKIGTKAKVTDEGLCRAVLDKCQNYTYDEKGTYNAYNDIVVNYIQRAMVNITAAQHKIISEYASSCMEDVADCYNQQVTQVNSWSATANANSVYTIMKNACRNVALTCSYAVFKDDTTYCSINEDENTSEEANKNKCIESISEVFYQSMLCPVNSQYDAASTSTTTVSANGKKQGYVNAKCKCNEGYFVFNGTCVANCGNNQYVNSLGVCTAIPTEKVGDNGACEENCIPTGYKDRS